MVDALASQKSSSASSRLVVQSGVVVGCTTLVAPGCLALAWNSVLQRTWLEQIWLYKRPHGIEELFACALVAGTSALITLRSARSGRARAVVSPALRWVAPIAVAAWAASWRIEEPRRDIDLMHALACAWTALVAAGARVERWPRAVVQLEKLLLAAALSLVTTELARRAWRAAAQPALLATPGIDARAFDAAHRRAPGRDHAAFPSDLHGYSDRGVQQLGPGRSWVACIGDSFSVGVVPHHRHYTTLAEKVLGLEVYNVGVAGAGPREHLQMLRDHVLPRGPRLVVIALFVGNDVEDATRRSTGALQRWTSADEVLVRVAALRVAKLWRATDIDTGARPADLASQATAAQIERVMPWLADPLLEAPAFSEERFTYIERARANSLLLVSEEAYEPLFEWLARIREAAAPVPVACLLIPDEFQVEDAVWASVVAAGLPAQSERDLPQRVIRARLEREGVAHADLLPLLRAVPPSAAGGSTTSATRTSMRAATRSRPAASRSWSSAVCHEYGPSHSKSAARAEPSANI